MKVGIALDDGHAGVRRRLASHSSNGLPVKVARLDSRSEALQSVELFVGAGGLALGLHRAGFLPILAVDSDIRAYETLQANTNHIGQYTAGWGVRHGDVHVMDYANLGSPDLLSAGAPCQPFSIGGQLRLEDDERNLLPEVLRAIRALRPRAFVLENVRGLLFRRTKPYFDYLIAQLRVPSRQMLLSETRSEHLRALRAIPEWEHEYRVDWRILNAADYGLPQLRKRLIITGVGAAELSWTWPVGTHNRDALIAELWDDAYWDQHEVTRQLRKSVRNRLPRRRNLPATEARWQTLRDLTQRLGAPHDENGGDLSHVSVPGARLYRNHTGSVLDWPAKTVKAGVHGSPGGEHIVVLDDGSYRYLTVRECAALQGFPDDYVWPQYRTQAMRLLGNAVPVTLAEAVGKQLAEALGHGSNR